MNSALVIDDSLKSFADFNLARAYQAPSALAPRFLRRATAIHALRGRSPEAMKRRWMLEHFDPDSSELQDPQRPSQPPLSFLDSANGIHRRTGAIGNEFELVLRSELGIGPGPDALLAGLEESHQVKLTIDCAGGDCSAAFELYEKLLPRDPLIEISGICGSSAVLIAMSGTQRRIHPDGRIMVHAMQSFIGGTAATLRNAAARLELFNARAVELIASRAGLDSALVQSWFADDRDHWFTAREALDLHLVTEFYDH